jgi:hypothetical protein
MKRKIKKAILKYFKLYTEQEVRNIFLEMQYEMAQQIIGNRGKDPQRIIPMDFFNERKK